MKDKKIKSFFWNPLWQPLVTLTAERATGWFRKNCENKSKFQFYISPTFHRVAYNTIVQKINNSNYDGKF